MAFASLDGLTFRINPSSIDWGFSIDTNVEDTIGGRVVQVVGATLSDITLSGFYGERKGYRYGDKGDKRNRLLSPRPGQALLSWELAEAFLKRVRDMMEKQSEDSTEQGKMQRPLDFKFPEYGWHFGVYVKGIDDGQSNAAITHRADHFSYTWRISLFIVEERSSALVVPGRGGSVADRKKAQAIDGYISRISAGVGWKKSKFNDPAAVSNAVTGQQGSTSPVSQGPSSSPAPRTQDRRLVQ